MLGKLPFESVGGIPGGRQKGEAVCFYPYKRVRGDASKMDSSKKITLTKAEEKLIEHVRGMDYGEIRIMIKDKHPIRIEEIRRSIQLTNDKK